jgi:hypothetical protein
MRPPAISSGPIEVDRIFADVAVRPHHGAPLHFGTIGFVRVRETEEAHAEVARRFAVLDGRLGTRRAAMQRSFDPN